MSILVRIVGGIVGRGAKTVAPINREMGTGSVKVVNIAKDVKEFSNFTGQKMSKKLYQNVINEGNTTITNSVKSGQNAKEGAAIRTVKNKFTSKKPTVKIKSNK